MNVFAIDNRELKKHIKMMKDSPKQFSYAAAGVINAAAFKVKEFDIGNLSSTMVIRDPRFLKAAIRVDKAKGRTNIALIEAHVYSIRKKGFTGWVEQETGKSTERKKIETKESRGGNIKSKVLSKYRLKKGNHFFRPQQYKGKTEKIRFQVMMKEMNKNNGGGIFMLPQSVKTKRGQIQRGLYELKKHKITRLQIFKDHVAAKTNRWRHNSKVQLDQRFDLKGEWEKNVKYYVDLFKKNAK